MLFATHGLLGAGRGSNILLEEKSFAKCGISFGYCVNSMFRAELMFTRTGMDIIQKRDFSVCFCLLENCKLIVWVIVA